MNPFFIAICVASLLIIPMLFYVEKIKTSNFLTYAQIYLVTLLISVIVFFSGVIVNLFGTEYNYLTVPSPIKEKIELFLQEAQKRNIDTSRIKDLKIKYLPWPYAPSIYSGACQIKENVLFIPERDISTTTVFHELGHCVLQYEHYLSPEYQSEIMYYSSSELQSLSSESLDRFFYQSPQSTLIAKGTEMSLKILLNPVLLIIGLFIGAILWVNLKNLFEVWTKK